MKLSDVLDGLRERDKKLTDKNVRMHGEVGFRSKAMFPHLMPELITLAPSAHPSPAVTDGPLDTCLDGIDQNISPDESVTISAERRLAEAWLFSHLDELARNYPNRWVAVVHSEVVAVGDGPVTVHEEAKRRFAGRDPVVWFVEGRMDDSP